MVKAKEKEAESKIRSIQLVLVTYPCVHVHVCSLYCKCITFITNSIKSALNLIYVLPFKAIN